MTASSSAWPSRSPTATAGRVGRPRSGLMTRRPRMQAAVHWTRKQATRPGSWMWAAFPGTWRRATRPGRWMWAAFPGAWMAAISKQARMPAVEKRAWLRTTHPGTLTRPAPHQTRMPAAFHQTRMPAAPPTGSPGLKSRGVSTRPSRSAWRAGLSARASSWPGGTTCIPRRRRCWSGAAGYGRACCAPRGGGRRCKPTRACRRGRGSCWREAGRASTSTRAPGR